MKHPKMAAPKKTLDQLVPTLRKDGRYMLTLRSPGKSPTSVYAKTEAECIKKAAQLLGLGGPRVRPGSIAEFVIEHYLDWQRPRVEFDTFRRYEHCWVKVLGPSLGHRLFDELTDENVQAGIRHGNYEAATAQNAKSVLKAIVRLAIAKHRATRDVEMMVAIAEVPTKHPKEREDIGDKAKRMLEAAEKLGHWTEGFIWTAQVLGLRKGELCSIKRADVDIEEGTLTIRRQRNHTSGEREKLKGRKAGQVRKIGLPKPILERLLSYFREDSIYLIVDEQGRPPTTSHFDRYLAPVESLANVHVTPHDFRSAAICNLVDAGADDRAIMDLVGHGSRAMIDHYRDLKTSRTREALSKLDSTRVQ